MTDIVRHRGPDDEGYAIFMRHSDPPLVCGGRDTPIDVYAGERPSRATMSIADAASMRARVALGHRRLSVIDVSANGHQPMASADGRYWISYNGEIYNHTELRAELATLGHRFSSSSDTEVLLAAYAEWGTSFVHHLVGMWAFALYDSRDRKLLLCRDRFGVKPLYYHRSAEGLLAFASEIKQLTLLPGWRARISAQRVYDFLVHGLSDHTDETMFAGVYQIPPGHLALIDCEHDLAGPGDGKLGTVQWYRLSPRRFDGSFEEACAEFRTHLTDSIRLHMRSDVRVGFCLSGGLDSSSIVCTANELLREQPTKADLFTFSACAKSPRFDERKWIDIVTAFTAVNAHHVYPDPSSLFSHSRGLTWHQDEPYGSTSIFAQWDVFRDAHRHQVKVMLDGQGADEQLAGYHSFFGPHLATMLRQLKLLEFVGDAAQMKRIHGYGFGSLLKYLATSFLPDDKLELLRRVGGYGSNAPSWLNLALLDANPVNPSLVDGARPATITDLSVSQLQHSNLQMLLHWEDRNSMAHSVESRVPFLDHRLVEFVVGLPDHYKLQKGTTKRVLRGAMQGVIPEAIRNRMDKLGFVTPEEIWLRHEHPDTFRARMESAIEASCGILRAEPARRLLEEVISGSRRFSFVPWRILCFGEWMDVFDVRA